MAEGNAAFPPRGRESGHFPVFGRGLLASSRAGTRLPIAAIPLRGTAGGAPPRTAAGPAGGRLPSPFRKNNKKSKGAGTPLLKNTSVLPTLALPKSGQRVEACASSQPPRRLPCFSCFRIPPAAAFVKSAKTNDENLVEFAGKTCISRRDGLYSVGQLKRGVR